MGENKPMYLIAGANYYKGNNGFGKFGIISFIEIVIILFNLSSASQPPMMKDYFESLQENNLQFFITYSRLTSEHLKPICFRTVLKDKQTFPVKSFSGAGNSPFCFF
jgi:hypothetical protein